MRWIRRANCSRGTGPRFRRRRTGNRADADDVLQEAWLRWSRVDHGSVADPGAYLFRLVTRQAIDELRRVRARREVHAEDGRADGTAASSPVGPRPVDAVAAGLLVVLQTLTPTERAVFLLHDVFGFSHAEIAAIVGRTERAVQQMAYRARRHVRGRRPRFRPTPGQHAAATERFLAAAALGGDLAGYGRACAASA
ncbi:MAG TPA: sigma-70 family RNA polymerase sigma factor [Pseudonocardia sp.]|nr:sigma-70 family RNA polymerase sigma factor [Pseudonocardia sp.]